MTNREIGLRLTHMRESRSFTTVTLGKKVGLSQAQISRLENGKQGFRCSTIARLADALGVPSFFFLMDSDQWETYQAGLRARSGSKPEGPRKRDGSETGER